MNCATYKITFIIDVGVCDYDVLVFLNDIILPMALAKMCQNFICYENKQRK